MPTDNQKLRQKFREHGRYAKVNVHYLSHPLTDNVGSDGVPFGDEALCLCQRCYQNTEKLTTVSQIKEYRKKLNG